MKPCQKCKTSTYHVSNFKSIGIRLAKRPYDEKDLKEWFRITLSCDGCGMIRSTLLRDEPEPWRSGYFMHTNTP